MTSVRILWRLLNPSPLWCGATVVLGTLACLSEGIGIALFIPILGGVQAGGTDISFPLAFGRVLPAGIRLHAGWLLLVVFLLVLLKNLLVYANRLLVAWIDAVTGHELRSRIFGCLMRAPVSFWDRRDPGKVLDTLANESWRASQAFQILCGSVAHACGAVVFTALLLAISWKLTVLVAAGLGLISAGIRFGMRRVRTAGEEAVRVNAELGARMWDGIAGIRSIHAFSLQQLKVSRFRETSDAVRKSFFRLEAYSGAVHPISEALHAGMLLGALFWLLPNGAPGASALVFLVLLFRLQPNVSQLQASWVTMTGMAGSIQATASLLESAGSRRIEPARQAFCGLREALLFREVSFRYEGESRPALDKISFRIPAGKITAIAGPSGAGKTTLIHLICRFYDPTEGGILADGRLFTSFDVETLRRRIGLACQDTHLFSATVRENIAFGAPDAGDDQILHAAIYAGAHDFIVQLPEGYETRVGERGVRLSGGQRQRIALARAFVREPEILLLDEATNALDSITEEAVSSTLRGMQGTRTIVLVAHRPATIRMADHVIVLDQGRVIEEGHPADLMRRGGMFAKLYGAPVQANSAAVCVTF